MFAKLKLTGFKIQGLRDTSGSHRLRPNRKNKLWLTAINKTVNNDVQVATKANFVSRKLLLVIKHVIWASGEEFKPAKLNFMFLQFGKKNILILIKLDGDTWVLVVRNTSTLYKYCKLQLCQIGIPENFFWYLKTNLFYIWRHYTNVLLTVTVAVGATSCCRPARDGGRPTERVEHQPVRLLRGHQDL